jgi:ribonuclease P protein component
MKYSFSKNEKVTSLKLIELLFSKKSENVFVFPYKVSFIFLPEQLDKNQVLVVVPKRNFKKAVDRNRIKRQIRELYRLNKEILEPKSNLVLPKMAISIAYIANTKIEYPHLEIAFKKTLNLIVQHAEKSYSIPIPPIN